MQGWDLDFHLTLLANACGNVAISQTKPVHMSTTFLLQIKYVSSYDNNGHSGCHCLGQVMTKPAICKYS